MSFVKDKYFLGFFSLGVIFLFSLSFFKTNFSFFWYLENPLGFFNLVIVASVVEEILFRGLLFDLFRRRYNETLTIVTTSILFGFAHVFLHSPIWALGVIIPGILFGILKAKTKKLYAPIALHFIYNLMYFSLYEV
jgi:membrane protease YdiL (CAAX protease family)